MRQRRRHGTPNFRTPVRESAPAATLDPPTQTTEVVTETITGRLAEATGDGPEVRRRILLITPGWGSSGYYAPEVLQAAARDGVSAGTHMYLDHPGEFEETDRPERSVRDLAAVLETNAAWNGRAGGLVATARIFGQHAAAINEMADSIGVSIRATANAHSGEVDGRTGLIIDRLLPSVVNSVDFVTKAGRGGKVMEVLESAPTEVREARNVGQWLEARMHLSFTELADDMYGQGRLTREERITLSAGIGDALAAFTARIEDSAPHLFQRDLWDEPDPPPVTATAETRTTTDVTDGQSALITTEEVMSQPTGQAPASDPGTNTGQQNTTPAAAGGQDTTGNAATPAATEAQLATVRAERDAAESRAQALAAAQRQRETAEAEREEARREVRQLRADNTARERITAALEESSIAPSVRPLLAPRITDRVIGRVPLTESGEVDDDALTAQINAAIEAESTHAAALLEAQGVGSVRGLGGTSGEKGLTEADFEKAMTDLLRGGVGLSETAAQRAAKDVRDMAKNIVYNPAEQLSVVPTAPAAPVSGDPILFGALPGVALTDADADGAVTAKFNGAARLSVTGDGPAAAAAITAGDIVYYDADVINVDATNGTRFGYAMEDVASGATAEILVKIGY